MTGIARCQDKISLNCGGGDEDVERALVDGSLALSEVDADIGRLHRDWPPNCNDADALEESPKITLSTFRARPAANAFEHFHVSDDANRQVLMQQSSDERLRGWSATKEVDGPIGIQEKAHRSTVRRLEPRAA